MWSERNNTLIMVADIFGVNPEDIKKGNRLKDHHLKERAKIEDIYKQIRRRNTVQNKKGGHHFGNRRQFWTRPRHIISSNGLT